MKRQIVSVGAGDRLSTVEDVDREFEAALKVVGQVRERVEEEQSGKRGARVPAGSPAS